jgi:hypothetical protein
LHGAALGQSLLTIYADQAYDEAHPCSRSERELPAKPCADMLPRSTAAVSRNHPSSLVLGTEPHSTRFEHGITGGARRRIRTGSYAIW